jgi:carboxymethylenebutenolidase
VADVHIPVAGGTLRAHLAVPTSGDRWPGVVVVHELFGLTDEIRTQADRIAEAGYLALAPDLYSWGATPRCLVATLRTLLTGSGRAVDDINACRGYLVARDDCSGRVGVLGFCLGGGLAMLVCADGFDVAAPNYGDVPRQAQRVLAGACPVVASYGGADRRLRGHAARLASTLSALDVEHDVKEYPGVKHGFLFPHTTGVGRLMEPLYIAYDASAAEDAWGRIFTYLDRYLHRADSDPTSANEGTTA